ncbi:MAG: hypothetical protein NTU69_12600 [Proteobacteria bacterium]|nr:hypothetical protein [Pseudomonadota bacterium]
MSNILKDPRASEYFTEDGLVMVTGISKYKWVEMFIKEPIDNSLDTLKNTSNKEIKIVYRNNLWGVCDSGNGIPEQDLDSIYDFSYYVSSKRHYRHVSRGALGNAIKCLIGVSYLRNLNLFFVLNKKKITYTPKKVLIDSKLINGAFKKSIEDTYFENGVYIDGLELDIDTIKKSINRYIQVNPGVAFYLNDEKLSEKIVSLPIKELNFLHWYDFESFKNLLVITHNNYSEKTVKHFCLENFTGMRGNLANLGFSFKKLSEFFDKEDEIRNLYNILKHDVIKKEPRPAILDKYYSVGENNCRKLCGVNNKFIKYKKIIGKYKQNEANIPFIIEGYVCNSENSELNSELIININNSITYSDSDFVFEYSFIRFCGKTDFFGSLNTLLEKAGFFKIKGYTLFLHLISPLVKYRDHAKSTISVEKFKIELVNLVENLVKDFLKKEQKEKREQKNSSCKRVNKTQLMRDHLLEAVDYCTDDKKVPTKARQVFYALRKIINNLYGITLNGESGQGILTQVVLTDFYKKYPWLEDLVFLERRGYYIDPVGWKEIPLGTQEINEFLDGMPKECSANIIGGEYRPAEISFDIPYELEISQVLFIEKQGFNEIFKRSKIMEELRLGIISGQGYGTRALKRLIQIFINRGIVCYSLHDCDLSGYCIGNKLSKGSQTFEDELDIIDIGLNYQDLVELGKDKIIDAEEYYSKKSYINVLKELSEDERNFFFVKETGTQFKYRRVEINALTTPELIEFIKKKIKPKPITPSLEQVEKLLDFDMFELIKRKAIGKVLERYSNNYFKELENVEIDFDDCNKMVKDAYRKVLSCSNTNGEKWDSVLKELLKDYINKKADKLLTLITPP